MPTLSLKYCHHRVCAFLIPPLLRPYDKSYGFCGRKAPWKKRKEHISPAKKLVLLLSLIQFISLRFHSSFTLVVHDLYVASVWTWLRTNSPREKTTKDWWPSSCSRLPWGASLAECIPFIVMASGKVLSGSLSLKRVSYDFVCEHTRTFACIHGGSDLLHCQHVSVSLSVIPTWAMAGRKRGSS